MTRGAAIEFEDEPLPVRVAFGRGRVASVGDELDRLGLSHALLVASPGRDGADAAVASLGERLGERFGDVRPHVPVEQSRQAIDIAAYGGVDCVVALGGGSAIGLAKSVAVQVGIPVVAIPTTYSGSEMTPIYGVTSGAGKRTARDAAALPRTAVYDPELTLGLPSQLTVASGLNAIAHCVAARSVPGSPAVHLMAIEALRALSGGLPRVVQAPADLDARTECLLGAQLAGAALARHGTGAHHVVCHVLGGLTGAAHAGLHAVVLPYGAELGAADDPDAGRELAEALGVERASDGLRALAGRLGAPRSLAELGVDRDVLAPAAAAVAQRLAGGRQEIAESAVLELLESAYDGAPSGRRSAE